MQVTGLSECTFQPSGSEAVQELGKPRISRSVMA